MKKYFNIKAFLNMGIVVLVTAASVTFETGCSKSKSNSATPAMDTLSSATLAASISGLVSSSQSGIAPQAESNARMFQNMSFVCGSAPIDTVFSGYDTAGGVTINYSMVYADTAFCTSGTLTKMDFYLNSFMDMSMTGMYFGGKNKMLMSMSGLDSAAANYVIAETCSGIDTIKETSPSTITCYTNMNYTASGITISKSTNQIISGNASIQYSYITAAGNTHNVSGTVKYIGNMQAVITLANGYTTTVSW